MKAEQRKQAIANELVWLPAAVDHCLRGCLQEAIDQEDGIERQARLGEPGRSAHVDEHADDIALLTDIAALAIADEIRAAIGGARPTALSNPTAAPATRRPAHPA